MDAREEVNQAQLAGRRASAARSIRYPQRMDGCDL